MTKTLWCRLYYCDPLAGRPAEWGLGEGPGRRVQGIPKVSGQGFAGAPVLFCLLARGLGFRPTFLPPLVDAWGCATGLRVGCVCLSSGGFSSSFRFAFPRRGSLGGSVVLLLVGVPAPRHRGGPAEHALTPRGGHSPAAHHPASRGGRPLPVCFSDNHRAAAGASATRRRLPGWEAG